MMGCRCFLTTFLMVVLLSFSFSQGFGRRVRVVRHIWKWHSHQPLHQENSGVVGRQMVEMRMDYTDPKANTNSRNGAFIYSPPSPAAVVAPPPQMHAL